MASKIINCAVWKKHKDTPTGIDFGCTKHGSIVINQLDENGLYANSSLKVGMKVLRVNNTDAQLHDPSTVRCIVNHQAVGRVVIKAVPYNDTQQAKPPKLAQGKIDASVEKFLKSAIDETRTIWQAGKERRAKGFWSRLRFDLAVKPKPPDWVWHDRGIARIYTDHATIRDFGQVVWGQIVQANNMLFDPYNRNEACGAAAIYSLDPHYDGRLDELDEIASSLFEQKGDQYKDEEFQTFSRVLSHESTTLMKQPVPKSLTGGRDVYYTSIVVHRKHLPVPYLREKMFPLLVAPDQTGTMILPKQYWSDKALSLWSSSIKEGHW